MAADRFSLRGSGELSGIAFILESEIHLWTTGIPHQCRRVVAGRLLLHHKPCEQRVECLQFITDNRTLCVLCGTYNEMGSRLAVLKEMPRHFGHGLLAYKEARPQRGRRTGHTGNMPGRTT